MPGDHWWSGLDDVVQEAVPPGARVLDVGCGDGAFVARLVERGLDAAGVDPSAPEHPRLYRTRVEELGPIGPFDAATSLLALHHAELPSALAAIGRLLAPHGRLLVYEFAWEDYDERAAAWVARHGAAGPKTSPAGWRADHAGLHPSTAVRDTIAAALDLRTDTEAPYLARMIDRHDLEGEEQELIDAGEVPAIGRWYVAGPPGRLGGDPAASAKA